MEKKIIQTVKKDLSIVSFESQKECEEWLEQNHALSNGIWLRLFKKNSGIPSINHALALEEALCYGWIDGQAKGYDADSHLQKFTPRRARSIWSKRNIENFERLVQDGRMKPSGMKAAEAAKADGRWDRAYDPPGSMTVPQDFLLELSKDAESLAFFEKLNKANKYAIVWRLQTARRPETREKRMTAILQMLARGEKFH